MQTQRCCILLSLLFTILLFHLSPTPAAAFPTRTSQLSDVDFIRKSCDNTSYPDICYSSLSPYARTVKQSQERLVRVSIAVSHSRLRSLAAYISSLARQGSSDPHIGIALKQCTEVFELSFDDMEKSLDRMRKSESISPPEIYDINVWMSGALDEEDLCIQGFEDIVPDGPEKSDVMNRTNETMKYVSIVLAFVVALRPPAGKETALTFG